MANKYDAVLTANADELEALAKNARSSMLSQTTEKATRLGSQGERLARQARAAETQAADANKLSADLLAEAAQFDARAQSLQQQAAAAAARGDYDGRRDATELNEEAAKAREGASVDRAKSQVAVEDAKRLAEEAATLRVQEQAIDAELADLGGRMPVTELAVDHLEWHAEKAREMADAVKQADDLQARAVAAAGRGDHVAAGELAARAQNLRHEADVIGFVREHPPFPADLRPLASIGVAVTEGDLSVPLPELIDPTSPLNPLADASTGSADGEEVAAGEPTASAGTADVTDGDAGALIGDDALVQDLVAGSSAAIDGQEHSPSVASLDAADSEGWSDEFDPLDSSDSLAPFGTSPFAQLAPVDASDESSGGPGELEQSDLFADGAALGSPDLEADPGLDDSGMFA